MSTRLTDIRTPLIGAETRRPVPGHADGNPTPSPSVGYSNLRSFYQFVKITSKRGTVPRQLPDLARYRWSMTAISTSVAPNGLPIHRLQLDGTRAVTALVAFDAGARTERPDENGMAHFLEHLVFKGGEKFSDYRAVNETAERIGGQLNAYTSHDLVAFHITV